MRSWLELSSPGQRVSVFWIAFASCAVLALDFFTGPLIQFPLALVFPVMLSAWRNGRNQAYIVAICVTIVSAMFAWYWDHEVVRVILFVNTAIRLAVFAILSVLTESLARYSIKLNRKIKVLEGLLPICSHCKKIRTDSDSWQHIESYISEHSEAMFSHGICPDCLKKYYSEFVTESSPKNPDK